MPFLIKKILGALLMPMSIIMAFGIAAAVCFRLGKIRVAKVLFVICLALLYVSSIQVTKNALVAPLENLYGKYQGQPVDYVIVLGGGHSSDERKPVSSLLSRTSFMRLMEGLRVHLLNPGSKLLLGGLGRRDEISNAEAMAKVAVAYGVSPENIITKPEPKDTQEEIQSWKAHVGEARVAIVSSAVHLPRAMALAKNADLESIAAPTAFVSSTSEELYWRSWIPSARNLYSLETAWHEYLGLIWVYLKS